MGKNKFEVVGIANKSCAVFFFVKKITSDNWFATLAALILIATPGYITEHGTRSGDYDAMLVFFQMIYIFAVLQKECIDFDELSLENNFYIKDLEINT